MQPVNCEKCGGILHGEANHPGMFRCGKCGTGKENN